LLPRSADLKREMSAMTWRPLRRRLLTGMMPELLLACGISLFNLCPFNAQYNQHNNQFEFEVNAKPDGNVRTE
jgi:hypothetical protein